MMTIKQITVQQAQQQQSSGATYLDVRSIPEFEQGHPTGAYNVPIAHLVPGRGMAPNPAFAEIVGKRFAKDDKIVCGCRSGGRSLRAAEMLASLGYTQVIDMAGGWEGEGSIAGWRPSGLPMALKAEPGHAYKDLE